MTEDTHLFTKNGENPRGLVIGWSVLMARRFMFAQDNGPRRRVRSVKLIVPEGVLRGRRKFEKRFALFHLYGDNRRNAAKGGRLAPRDAAGPAGPSPIVFLASPRIFWKRPVYFQRDRVSDNRSGTAWQSIVMSASNPILMNKLPARTAPAR
jgi:hypothetical protein